MKGEYTQRLLQLRARYRRSLEEKSTRLGLLKEDLRQDGAESLAALAQLLHMLAGSAAVFGLSHVSAHAALIERQVLAQKEGASEEDRQALSAALDELIAEIRALASPEKVAWLEEEPIAGARQGRPVMVLEDDHLYAEWLKTQIESRGYRVECHADASRLEARLQSVEPLALVVDVMLEEGDLSGLECLSRIGAQRLADDKPPLPAVVVSLRDDFESRLKAVRAGATWYLTKPLDVDQLFLALEELIEKRPREPYRILLVDDDEDLLKLYQLFLEEKGMEVRTETDPRKVLDVINQFRPELIVLDLYMPECSGIELGQVIRQHHRLASIPIVFLSSETNPEKQLQAVRVAGDDFLTKPIEPWKLTQDLLARVRRARMVNRYIRSLVKDLAYKERHDPLTGLPNRSVFEARLKAAMERARRKRQGLMVLMLVDIDNFQHINDVFGHEVGDALILDMAQRLGSALPRQAVLSREGGDEFAILLTSLPDFERVRNLCEHLNRIAAMPFFVTGQEIELTLSIGVVIYTGKETSGPKDLIKHADTALYHAKATSKGGYVFFEEAMARALRERVALLHDLRRATVQNQLVLHVQPQFDCRTGQICGAEMLIRWQHPERGLVPPSEFIPVAESTGLIQQIGEWVLEQSARAVQHWHEHWGWRHPVAVNVSPGQFARVDFVENVARILRQSRLPDGLIEIEVTEGVLATNHQQAVETLNRLKRLGVRIAIDDFGTGYSNLAALKSYPVDLLKVDRSFVDGLPDDEHDAAITSTILNMGRNLGFRTLAEGVETEAQLEWLRNAGCDAMQGYLKARPMALDAFERQWLTHLANGNA
ncbi:EAL domain-containing protein [Hahella sp. SMD15-11]|uniref:cyclic-guanylate-specific phosphodiesterase n=1 Tax=Thermohahella caldifontis TaxID=3142973 RepID=A0AB39UZF4_9GAMM